MKKRLFSTLLVGVLAITSVSMFSSCKDYDEDINANTARIETLEKSLKDAKADLESRMATLKSELETAIGSKVDKKEYDAKVAAIEARLRTAEDALGDINALLEKKVDQKEFDAKVKEIYGKLEAVETNLGEKIAQEVKDRDKAIEAARADLQQQIDALNAFKKTVEDLKLAEKLEDLTEQLEDLQGKVDGLGDEVDSLTEQLQNLSKKIDAVQKEVNVLNVLIWQQLRSLVFIPDGYYSGVEATKMIVLDFFKYKDIPSAAYDKKEAKGYSESIAYGTPGSRTAHERYDSIPDARVLNFVANYYMNPSSADMKQVKELRILSDDKPVYETKAAAAAPFSVIDYKAEKGVLSVNIKVANPSKIKTVKNDKAYTVFAAQAVLGKGGTETPDTTVTSDYATLVKETVKDLRLAHTIATGYATGVENTHCGTSVLEGPDASHQHHGLLMATVAEAVHFGAQDEVVYNKTVDLRKLVETHYTTVEGKHNLMSSENMKANGLSYKFELTGYYVGNNKTSESAHAAIAEDGFTFRPQMVEQGTGKQQKYGAAQGRQTIGRTPIVRVELVDNENNVLDYGYIMIEITDAKAVPGPDKHITYVSDTKYNFETSNIVCDPHKDAYTYRTMWYQTEYDLYNLVGLSREEFKAHYTPEYAASNEMKQYTPNPVDGKPGQYTFTATDAAKYVGTVSHLEEPTPSGANTEVMEWNLTADEAYEAFVTNKKTELMTAVVFRSNTNKYPDLFVLFKTDPSKIHVTVDQVKGVVDFENKTIGNYWYAKNTSNAGTDEIHVNTKSYEDNKTGTADVFEMHLSDVFMGRKIDAALISKLVDQTGADVQKPSDVKLNLVFSETNKGKRFKGVDGKEYELTVSNDGKGLMANVVGNTGVSYQVAKLSSPADVKDTKIGYNHSEGAHALLNYMAHNKLNDQTLNAIVGIKATVGSCSAELPLDNNTFNVRFLRPLNVQGTDKEVEDASTSGPQILNLKDLVKFTDWRDNWKPEYYNYFGITSIEIPGVNDGESISKNKDVKTDLGQVDGKYVALNTVTDQLDFVYNTNTAGNTLTYSNLGATVQKFHVQIPVVVRYIWGYLTSTVTVTVNRTSGNAKRY